LLEENFKEGMRDYQLNDYQGSGRSTAAAHEIELGADMNLCITEILDTRTQRMISSNALLVASADYLQTNEMASRVLAQVVVRKELKFVFDELLGAKGNSLYLRPATSYLHLNEYKETPPYTECVCFMGLAKRAFSRGEILMGIKQGGKKPVINPKDKLLVDTDIDWRSTELIIMQQSVSKPAGKKAKAKVRSIPPQELATTERVAERRCSLSTDGRNNSAAVSEGAIDRAVRAQFDGGSSAEVGDVTAAMAADMTGQLMQQRSKSPVLVEPVLVPAGESKPKPAVDDGTRDQIMAALQEQQQERKDMKQQVAELTALVLQLAQGMPGSGGAVSGASGAPPEEMV
jgi:hypothetical protein